MEGSWRMSRSERKGWLRCDARRGREWPRRESLVMEWMRVPGNKMHFVDRPVDRCDRHRPQGARCLVADRDVCRWPHVLQTAAPRERCVQRTGQHAEAVHVVTRAECPMHAV